MRWTEVAAPAPKSVAPAVPRPSVLAAPKTQARRRGQAADHPWHQAVPDHYAYQQFAKDRRAWERVQP
jgi:hypothetical protein